MKPTNKAAIRFTVLIGLVLAVAIGCLLATQLAAAPKNADDPARIENWKGKTIMVLTPHPDDDTFACGGTMARLAANGNKIIIVIYTNDNKGSKDLDMTSERLAWIRKAEEEKACAVLGIPAENIIWLGYDDGELEYAPRKELRGQVARLIKIHRPDAIFAPDPGRVYEKWHKTDHRMAAFNTADAILAAEWHLYYPEHWMLEHLKPYQVPLCFLYYGDPQDTNYEVDIQDVFAKKLEACAAHVSQFEPSLSDYRPDWDPEARKRLDKWAQRLTKRRDGRAVETFRSTNDPN